MNKLLLILLVLIASLFLLQIKTHQAYAQSISNLNFELSTGNAGWWQAIGEDVRYNPTYDNNAIANVDNQTCTPPPTPSATGAYAIMDAGNFPGIFFTGKPNPFTTGNASANRKNWLVTNETDANYPDTEFNRLYNRIKNNNASLIDATYFDGNISSFPSSAKVYIVDPCASALGPYRTDTYNPTPCSQTVTLGTVGGSHLSASALTNYIFLINGNLQINNTLSVPVGSTALFSVSGKITVDGSVANTTPTPPSSTCNPNHDEIDGTFVAGKDFDIPSGHTCPVADNQLVISGSVITDAQGTGGYSFHSERSLCSSDSTTPAVIIQARPDFVLNAPELIKTPDTSYQELAPM